MKKRVLFSACILAACLGACTNDDFQEVRQQGNATENANEVVGAVLASKGMKVNIVGEDGSADTRATNGAWENGDRFGLAWFNFQSGDITNEQSKSVWDNYPSGWSKDNNIYANHLFLYDATGKAFYTFADVYEGGYFAYFPYAKRGDIGVKPMIVSANGEMQTEDYMTERYNKALHLSGREFIMPGDAMDGDMLEKDIYMLPVVNALGVIAKPDADEMEMSPWLKNMQITKMQIFTGTDDQVFVDGGTLAPRFIPEVKYTETGDINYEATREAMDAEAAKAAQGSTFLTDVTEASNSITTNVEKKADFNLTASRHLRAFAFPILKGINYVKDQAPYISITVSSPNDNWELGRYRVDQYNSPVVIGTLKNALSATNTGNTSLTKIMRDDATWMAFETENTMLANLVVKDFTPTTNGITCQTQWDELVELINALDAAKKTNFFEQAATEDQEAYKYVEFTLGDNVEMDGHINVPNNIKIHLNTNGHTLQIKGEVEWPAGLIVDTTDKIEVREGAKLYVGATGTESEGAEIKLDANITNKGTIYAGSMASISTKESMKKLTNNGTIIVEYGAYVYPDENAVGTIAFEVKDADMETMGHINTLIKKKAASDIDTQDQFAYVNTLIVQGTTLNLNAQVTVADDDRYNPVDATYLLPLDEIDIVLENGTVIYDPNTPANNNGYTNVKNVIARSGKNTMQDVIPQADITVEKEGELTITSGIYDMYGNDKDLRLTEGASINNYHILNVTTTIYTTNISNPSGSVANVDENGVGVDGREYIYYSGTYTQGGQANGWILLDPNSSKYDFSDSEKAVVQAYNDLVPSLGNVSDIAGLVEFVNGRIAMTSATTDWDSIKFYNAFAAWLGLTPFTDKDSALSLTKLTVQMLQNFETQTGFHFFN